MIKFITVLLLLVFELVAGVSSYVNKSVVTMGDNVAFIISSDQKDTIFPAISKIGPYPILSTPTSTSTQIINGKYSFSKTKSYIFTPLKDVTIPSFIVKAGGKEYKTKPIFIKVTKPTMTKNRPYRFACTT